MLSPIDNNGEWLAHHSKRQARRSCNPRAHKRSHCGIRHFHQKHVKRRANADGEGILSARLNKNVVPYGTFTMSVLGKGQQSFVRKY